MCRLYGFRSNELTKVECSLVNAQNALLVQSRSDETGRTHADGWGIACYDDPSGHSPHFPDLVRHKTAAFDDDHFSHSAESTYANTVVAHVRLSTVGCTSTLNAHPFQYDEWSFAHNGTLTGFSNISEQLDAETGRRQDARVGQTDSEQFFLWLLSRLERDGVDLSAPKKDDVTFAIAEALSVLDGRCRDASGEPPKLTFILTNGVQMYACRWGNPLYELVRDGVHDCEICGVPHVRHDDSVDYRAVLFASEPVSSEAWKEVPEHSLSVIDESLHPVTTYLPDAIVQ